MATITLGQFSVGPAVKFAPIRGTTETREGILGSASLLAAPAGGDGLPGSSKEQVTPRQRITPTALAAALSTFVTSIDAADLKTAPPNTVVQVPSGSSNGTAAAKPGHVSPTSSAYGNTGTRHSQYPPGNADDPTIGMGYRQALARIQSLEAAIQYIQKNHAEVLSALHSEVARLQGTCSELSFKLALAEDELVGLKGLPSRDHQPFRREIGTQANEPSKPLTADKFERKPLVSAFTQTTASSFSSPAGSTQSLLPSIPSVRRSDDPSSSQVLPPVFPTPPLASAPASAGGSVRMAKLLEAQLSKAHEEIDQLRWQLSVAQSMPLNSSEAAVFEQFRSNIVREDQEDSSEQVKEENIAGYSGKNNYEFVDDATTPQSVSDAATTERSEGRIQRRSTNHMLKSGHPVHGRELGRLADQSGKEQVDLGTVGIAGTGLKTSPDRGATIGKRKEASPSRPIDGALVDFAVPQGAGPHPPPPTATGPHAPNVHASPRIAKLLSPKHAVPHPDSTTLPTPSLRPLVVRVGVVPPAPPSQSVQTTLKLPPIDQRTASGEISVAQQNEPPLVLPKMTPSIGRGAVGIIQRREQLKHQQMNRK